MNADHHGRVAAYDKSGRPMTIQEWGERMKDIAYRRIDFDTVEHLDVSTVWVGLDHSFGDGGPPLIFETMVFGDDDERTERYATEAEAKAGHLKLVRQLRNELLP